MTDKPETILDHSSENFNSDSIDFDLKMVRGFALSYFIYGLVYWIQIKEFLVPLPMVYFFVPVAGVLMFVRSLKWYWNVIFLLIPFVVIKDFTLNNYPNFSGVLLIITFLIWSAWSWMVWSKSKERGVTDWILPLSQSSIWLIWLVQNSIVQISVIALMLVGVTIFVRKKVEVQSYTENVRVGLLIQLVLVLFLMQQFSIYWVSLD